MTDQAEPGRPPAHDLAAFDLSRQSPEQLARSFARWKAQRKRAPAAAQTATPVDPKAGAKATAASGSAGQRAAAPRRLRSMRYSDPFAELLAAGSEPAVRRTEPPPIVVARPSPKRRLSPARKLRTMTILAGAASVSAFAGGALLELSDWRKTPQAPPPATESKAAEVSRALPIVAAALRAPEWKLQRAVDLALMKAAPTIQRAAKPAPPKVETASKAAASSKPASPPTIKTAAPEPLRFVAKPFVPSAAAVPNAVPATQRSAATPARSVTALVRSGDPRPDALFQHRGGQGDGSLGAAMASNRAPSVGKRSDTADSKNSAEARAAAARAGTAADTEGDPHGKVSNGARAESEIGAGGAGPAADDGGAAASNGAAGNDARGSEAGAGGAAGTDAGSAANNTSGGGEKNESDGNGGAVSGALGGIGGALGGDGSNPADHADKDQKD